MAELTTFLAVVGVFGLACAIAEGVMALYRWAERQREDVGYRSEGRWR